MFESLNKVINGYGLISGFAIIGVTMAVSYWLSARLTRGRLHGSAIAIFLGLVLSYVGGVATGLVAALKHFALRRQHLLEIPPDEQDLVVVRRRQVLEEERDDLEALPAGVVQPRRVAGLVEFFDPLELVIAVRVVVVRRADAVDYCLESAGRHHAHEHGCPGARQPRDDDHRLLDARRSVTEQPS